MGDDGLSGVDVDHAGLRRYAQSAFQDDGVLLGIGSLAGLLPSGGAAHVGDAHRFSAGVHATDVFVDELGLIASGGYASGAVDESRQVCSPIGKIAWSARRIQNPCLMKK